MSTLINALGIIPARFSSSRFPGKPLIDIAGKSMIQRVFEQAKQSFLLKNICIATDDARIFDHVMSFGGQAIMTSNRHVSGTDRCLEAYLNIGQNADVIVNIQGDEPFIDPAHINQLVACFLNEQTQLATLVKVVEHANDLLDPNKPKVVLDQDGFALYFSRQCIPFIRGYSPENWLSQHVFYQHIGLYAYRPNTLKELCQLSSCDLEKAESLEQLRWISNGFKIKTETVKGDSFGIDTPEDLEKALLWLKTKN